MADFLKKFLGNISGEKSTSFIGIDLGSSAIKVVQLKKKKGVVVLETYGELSLGSYADTAQGRATSLTSQETSVALADLIKEANVTARDCGVSIPIKSSLVFVMEMPNLEEKQLAQMIPIEARKYIPVPITEVDLDWKIIPREDISSADSDDKNNKDKKSSEKINVLAVAIHKDAISKQREIISGAQLNLKFLEIEIFSTIRSVAGQGTSNFAVLDVGSGSTKLYIVDKGMIVDSHIIGRGSQNITLNISTALGISIDEAERLKKKVGVAGISEEEKKISDIVSISLEYIFIESNKIISNYQRKFNKNIDKLIVVGGGSVINGMLPFATSKVQTEVEIANPFSKVEFPAFLENLLKEVGPGFAVALGLALRGLKETE